MRLTFLLAVADTSAQSNGNVSKVGEQQVPCGALSAENRFQRRQYKTRIGGLEYETRPIKHAEAVFYQKER